MLSIVRPPVLVKKFYHKFTWSIPVNNNEIFLTFDDGPVAGPTEFVLDQLKAYEAKATFFCIGNNVKKNPGIYNRILSEGHRTGNHTFNHINGWLSTSKKYINEVEQAATVINSDLFRPPYGRVRLSQSEAILKNYRIIMWDVLSYDFDQLISPKQCLKNVLENTRPGSIIVFHDSLKAFRNLKQVLPECLIQLKNKGYQFQTIR